MEKIKTKKNQIEDIIKSIELINNYYNNENINNKDMLIITKNDSKLLHFIFLYLFKSLKFKEFLTFFKLKEKGNYGNSDNNIQISSTNIKILIQKFINICLINSINLSKYLGISNNNFNAKILKMTKIIFLNDYIDNDTLQNILCFQIISSLYKVNQTNKTKKNDIQNIQNLYLTFDFLLSFCNDNKKNIKKNKLEQFNKVVNYFVEIINQYILINFNNKIILSRNKRFYDLISLSQVTSLGLTSKIIQLIVDVYKHKLDIDYALDDLSDQFLYNTKKETISNKTNLLIAKNIFLNELFEKEKVSFREENIFIKNGFYFDDCPNNGIFCDPINVFPKNGYSIVISFRLMNDDIIDISNDKSIYTIFTLNNKDKDDSLIMSLFIQDYKLKIKFKKEKKINEIYEIKKNTNYVIWIIQKNKGKMICFINDFKYVVNKAIYPDGKYKINLGFENSNNDSKNNFVGIIGTFFLFKKSLIKDENDYINITKLTELKGNYEDIIYVKTNRDWSFIDKNLNLILNKLSNDINIYNDIEVIISSRSLGKINSYDDNNYSNYLNDSQNQYFCNYFQKYSDNEPKFHFRDVNHKDIKINYPIEFHNTYIEFLNNHGFLYLQLELYYFINVLSLRLNEEKKDNISNLNDNQNVYLNISTICSLFFFCFDSLNSNIIVNKMQYDLIQKEIDNFKYTLIDLITIYSKYNCKIKIYFLSLFVEKISEKKYFDYCLFILTPEYYDVNDNEAFDTLFNYLNHISIDDCDNSQIIKLFIKILDFDKIYITNEIKKETRKEYSKLIRYLIKKSMDEQIEECFNIYRKKVKNLKEEFIKNNIFIDDIVEDYNNEVEGRSNRISSEDCNNENCNRTSSKVSTNKNISENDNTINEEKTNINLLKLLYKYLKNLYIGIKDVKKKFVELCYDRKDFISDFFNDLYFSLCQIYNIQKEEYDNLTPNEKNEEIIIAELIKSICIRFLDDLYYEENLKIIEEESKKQKNDDNFQDEYDNKIGSSSGLKNSYNSCKSTIRPNLNNSKRSSFMKTESLGNLGNSSHSSFSNNLPLTIEGILTRKMNFFDKIVLSPYTFKSLYFMLFRDLSNDIKIKIIKSDKNKKKRFLMTDKHFSKTRYLLGVVISLFEKINSNCIDTVFMSKVDLLEYCYDIFIDLLKNMLDNFLESNNLRRKNIKPMINIIFCDKGNNYNAHRFYIIMMENISNFNYSGCSKNKESIDLIKKQLDKLLIKVQNDITEIIDKSLCESVDFFYFKFLREIYTQNELNNNYVINTTVRIMEKMTKRLEENDINRIIEINCKNILILLYKIVFFVSRRHLILTNENNLFLKNIIFFLSKFIDKCNILYTKILFPIEENSKYSKKKLLYEMVFEIFVEMHLDFLRHPNMQSLQVSEFLLKNLFNEVRIGDNLKGKIRYKNIEKNQVYTPFYIMDKISYFNTNNVIKDRCKISEDIYINKQYFDLKDYLLSKYKDEYKEDKNLFSVCIIFAIKIIISIKEINDCYKSLNKEKQAKTVIVNDNKQEIVSEDTFNLELKKQFINLTKNIIKIHKENISLNPFKSIGYHSNNIYEIFRSFIVDKFFFEEGDAETKIQELINKSSENPKSLKIYNRVIYTNEGRIKSYSDKTYNQIMNQRKNEIKDSESNGSLNDKKSNYSKEERNNSLTYSSSLKGSLKGSFNTINITNKAAIRTNISLNSRSQRQLYKVDFVLTNVINDDSDKILYKATIKFKKDLIRNYFSFYFNKLLSYDEDFVNMKKIYAYTYCKQIQNIDDYGISYPTKFKNYITNNYNRIFIKKDFSFFTDVYFKYSHSFLFKQKYKFEIRNKLLFPNKKLLDENDYAHKDIANNIMNLTIYECEMLTPKGSIFGDITIFDNCLLFKSDLKNDKRKIKFNKTKGKTDGASGSINYLNYACCSIDFDHLNLNKKIIIEFKDIKEVINRLFFYSWISLEIFMKNGQSYLFNFFNEDTNDDVMGIFKEKKILTIQYLADYFKSKDYSKKWKEEKISTFDYLLLLNKMSSRTFNDPNQYPIMPWLFLKDGISSRRNFDLPISVQDKDKQEQYLTNKNYSLNEKSQTQGNHYSTSAYILFYLMRTNPFTNNMIKFQSNNFDIPERQYCDIKQTISLCQRMNNNREIIPELFSIPEIFINLNDNDFGQQKEGIRVHNISFEPYAKNAFEFSYLLKDLMNNDEEINKEINKWFDFIFGVNQTGNYISKNNNYTSKEKEDLKLLRKFSSYSYGQYNNIKKLILESKKKNTSDEDLLSKVKTNIAISINFGQCPYQLLTERHPSKYIILDRREKEKNMPQLSNEDIDDILSRSNSTNLTFNYNRKNPLIQNYENNKEILFKKEKGELLYFFNSYSSNYLYCLLSNNNLVSYKLDNKNKLNEYNFVDTISPNGQCLIYKNKINRNFILKPKYKFCELSPNSFIFCQNLDKTIKYINDGKEISILLKSYTTSIIRTNNDEFITGHENGKICKWKIDYSKKDNKIELYLILMIKSNKGPITSLIFNERYNIIVSADNNTLMIRKNYDFEYLTSIKIENEDHLKKYIVDIKISEYDMLYASVFVEDRNVYELQGFSLNGTFFNKYKGNFSNFEINRKGKIIVSEINQPILKILDPINFNEIYSKDFSIDGSTFFHFEFQKPNILYYGVKENDTTKIKIVYLEQNEEKFFI